MSVTHSWNVTPKEARAIQDRLREGVVQCDELPWPPDRVAGIDVGFEDSGRVTRAAAVVLRYPGLEELEHAIVRRDTSFPYVPGLLSFRECPAALAALEALTLQPDVLVCDGQGYAHPRRFGIACHLGLLTGIASVGVAKTRLTGAHGVLPQRKGAWVPLRDEDEVIGAVLRTRTGVQPVYVSVGHRVTLGTAIELVLGLTPRYRLPETTRLAHRLASG
jgi:deoxyribonuclease V